MARPRRRKDCRDPQLGLTFRTRGGRRPGAGRKPNGDSAGVSHLTRPALAPRFPVHVTLRVTREVWNLRSRRMFSVIGHAFSLAAGRDDWRLCEFAVLGNHIHLIVEARSKVALARGMQSLCIRIARRLNRRMGRRGRVFADRYHSRILRTPTEVLLTRRYVRENHRRHYALPAHVVNPCSSAAPDHGVRLGVPRTWLLRRSHTVALLR